MIIAGIGLSTSCSADEIITLIRQACAERQVEASAIAIMATVAEKASLPALSAAAATIGAAIVAPPASRLRAVADRCLTRSERVAERYGLPSVSEAAALAAAPDGSVLIGPRIASLRATIALVQT